MNGDLAAPFSGQKKALLTQGSFNESKVILMEKQKQCNYGQPGSMEYILRSMVSKSDRGVVNMAPGTAKRILDELNFPGQRPIFSSRVYGKSLAIVTGDWIESFPIDFAALPDGRIWLVDGQHRVTAISRQQAPVPVTVRLIDVDSEKDAKKLYAGYDQGESVRTTKQILNAVGIAHELGISEKLAKSIYEAAPILLNNMEPITGSVNVRLFPEVFAKQRRMEAICEWANEAREYEGIISESTTALRQKLQTSGPVSVGLFTLRHQPARAREFWAGIAKNDGLRRFDPRSTLIQDYLVRGVGTGSSRQRVQQTTLAWNAFCEGRDLKIIKCIEGAPIVIWGTPVKAKK
jgi:hypothetical protein